MADAAQQKLTPKRKGKRTMKIDVPSQRTIEDIDDQTTHEGIIYWMTLASLVVITSILLSACGPANGSGTASSDGAEQPTISAPTNEPLFTMTAEPTETPIPTELLPTAAQITQTEPTLPSEVITPEAPTFNLEALDFSYPNRSGLVCLKCGHMTETPKLSLHEMLPVLNSITKTKPQF